MSEMQEAIGLLRELVELDSQPGQEAVAAQQYVKKLQKLGLSAWIDESHNVFGSLELGGEPQEEQRQRQIFLVAQGDTAEGWIEPQVEEGRLYGRGTVAAKAPLSIFLWNVHQLLREQYEAPQPVRLTVVILADGESLHSRGVKWLQEEGVVVPAEKKRKSLTLRPDVMIAGVPSEANGIVVAHRGEVQIKAQFRQESVEPGGENRSSLNNAFDWLQDLNRWLRGKYPFTSSFETPSLDLDSLDQKLEGGRWRVEMDVRLFTPVFFKEGMEEPFDLEPLQQWLEENTFGGKVEIKGQRPGLLVKQDRSVVQELARAIGQVGLSPVLKKRITSSYLGALSELWRLPVIGYGPGDASLAHGMSEQVALSEFEQSMKVFNVFLRQVTESRV